MNGLSWKPKRRGRIYCASACGHGCTWIAYRMAQTDARLLIARLERYFGGGWKPRVWENGGWHYQVRRGTLVVGPASGGRFHAFVAREVGDAGAEPFAWGDGTTSRSAVLHAVRNVRAKAEELEARIASTRVDLSRFR